jgi:hypothetical protein
MTVDARRTQTGGKFHRQVGFYKKQPLFTRNILNRFCAISAQEGAQAKFTQYNPHISSRAFGLQGRPPSGPRIGKADCPGGCDEGLAACRSSRRTSTYSTAPFRAPPWRARTPALHCADRARLRPRRHPFGTVGRLPRPVGAAAESAVVATSGLSSFRKFSKTRGNPVVQALSLVCAQLDQPTMKRGIDPQQESA